MTNTEVTSVDITNGEPIKAAQKWSRRQSHIPPYKNTFDYWHILCTEYLCVYGLFCAPDSENLFGPFYA